MNAFVAALLILATVCGSSAQECTLQTCAEQTQLFKFAGVAATSPLFTAADAQCNDTVSVFTGVATSCLTELSVPDGCACNAGATCASTVAAIPANCIAAINTILCEQAAAVESEYKVNVRGLFQHLANDCGKASPKYTCPGVAPFDVTVCGLTPANSTAQPAGNTTTKSPSPAAASPAATTPPPSNGSGAAGMTLAALGVTILAALFY